MLKKAVHNLVPRLCVHDAPNKSCHKHNKKKAIDLKFRILDYYNINLLLTSFFNIISIQLDTNVLEANKV